MPYQIRLGHKQLSGSQTLPMPSTLFISNEDESVGFRLQMSESGELIVSKFDHENLSEQINVQPNTSNQITLS